MSVTLVQEAAEAINSALFQTDFQALGDSEDGRIDWWHRGEPGTLRQLRVSVAKSDLISYVVVLAEWPIVRDAVRGRGQITWQVPCDGTQPRDKVMESTSEVVIKVLELYRDILSGTGFAAALTTPKESSDES